MYRIQEFMKYQTMEDPNGIKFVLIPFIFPKFKSTSKCPVPTCNSCLSARSNKRPIGTKKNNIVPVKEVILSRNKYKPVYLVSAYQFLVNTPGQFTTGYGLYYSSSFFHGGTLYNDAVTGIVWVENQLYLGASEAVL